MSAPGRLCEALYFSDKQAENDMSGLSKFLCELPTVGTGACATGTQQIHGNKSWNEISFV
jgi:hypothetical protein